MAQLTPEEIYLVARHAGFSPDQAVTMTAIALAESGGRIDAHNSTGEDSRGLWQINFADHAFPGMDSTNPLDNAKMAFTVSKSGSDIGRWTVTHADKGARYLDFRDEAERAAATFGESDAHGNWDPPANYHSPKVAAGFDPFRPPPADLDDDLTLLHHDAGPDVGGVGIEAFLEAALAQDGDTYVFGHETKVDDANPDTFDCSELVQWAAGRAGVDFPDGSWIQYSHLRQAGSDMSVEEALRTPGALLFRFSSDPLAGGRPGSAHVAISLGDGRTIEARSSKDGVGIFSAEDRGWTHAGSIAELGSIDSLPGFTEPLPFGQDSDGDGLLDAYETMIGTDPLDPDSDHDGFTDSTELVQHRTDPLDAGSNFMSRATGLRPVAPILPGLDRSADDRLQRSAPTTSGRSTGSSVDDRAEHRNVDPPRAPDRGHDAGPDGGHDTLDGIDSQDSHDVADDMPSAGHGGIADAPAIEDLGDGHHDDGAGHFDANADHSFDDHLDHAHGGDHHDDHGGPIDADHDVHHDDP